MEGNDNIWEKNEKGPPAPAKTGKTFTHWPPQWELRQESTKRDADQGETMFEITPQHMPRTKQSITGRVKGKKTGVIKHTPYWGKKVTWGGADKKDRIDT